VLWAKIIVALTGGIVIAYSFSDHNIHFVRTFSASCGDCTGGVWLDEVEIESLGEEPASTPQSVSLETIVQ